MFKETHGERKTRLYRIWWSIIGRCKYKSHTSYKWYGAKGIKVCEEWKTYENFSKWAKSHGYDDTLTIDRLNSDGDYEPNNCRWVDEKTQANNRKTNHYITIDGITKTLQEWCEIYRIDHSTVLARIKYGWSEKQAVTTPIRGNKKSAI